MDLPSILLLAALLVGGLLVLGGESARVRGERLLSALADVENGVRAFYARLAETAADPSTPRVLQWLLAAFVRVSHHVWLSVAVLFVLLAYYGKGLRTLIRGFLY